MFLNEEIELMCLNEGITTEEFIEAYNELCESKEMDQFKKDFNKGMDAGRKGFNAVMGPWVAKSAAGAGIGAALGISQSKKIKDLKNSDIAKIKYAEYKRKGGKNDFNKWLKTEILKARLTGTAGWLGAAYSTIATGAKLGGQIAGNKTIKSAKKSANSVFDEVDKKHNNSSSNNDIIDADFEEL